MNVPEFDLIICGGGVIGLSIAYQCAKNGWRICVIERGSFGRESSWAGAGILPSGALVSPLDPLEQLRALSHPLHKAWAKELFDLTGIDNEFRECGGLYLGRTPAEKATLIANTLWMDEHRIPYQQWDENQARMKVPPLETSQRLYLAPQNNTSNNSRKDATTSYWWMPDDCRVRNPYHIKALIAANKALGVQLLEGVQVLKIESRPNGQNHVRTSRGEMISGRKVCVTAGAWSQTLMEPLGVQTGILPVRGQMVLYKLDEPIFTCVINDGHRYLMPRDDGHILAGSCEEEVGFDCSTTESMIDELKRWAQGIIPALSNAPIVKTWAGLRPGSFDAYPYIGAIPGHEGVFIASGHFRHGLHWSTGTALLMQQLMFEEQTSIELDPFRVLRGANSRT